MVDFNTKSVAFVGASSQYVTLGDVLGFERTDTRSISLWAKWTSTAASMALVAKLGDAPTYRGFQVVARTSGAIEFDLISTTVTNQLSVYTTATGYNDDIWHHILVTYAGTSLPAGIKIYIDGWSKALTTNTNNLSATIITTNSLYFGGRATSGNNIYYTGDLDEVAFYDKVLSNAEMQEIRHAGPVDLTTLSTAGNLLGWWRMGDGDTHPTLIDGYSTNDGTMTNMSAGSIISDVPATSNSQRRGNSSTLSPTGQTQTLTPLSSRGDAYESFGTIYSGHDVPSYISKQRFEIAGGGTSTVTNYYHMVGYDTVLTQLVSWRVTGTPDFTGAQYSTPANLNTSTIRVAASWLV